MSTGVWEINEISLVEGGVQIRVAAPAHLQPQPGQYFLAYAAGKDEPLATPMFVAHRIDGDWQLTGKFPVTWQPGTRLRWRGPLGRGFHLPSTARHVALAVWDQWTACLALIVNQALAQDASVVWYGQRLPEHLPPSVEVLPLESVADAWDWADYLAMECDYRSIGRLIQDLTFVSQRKTACRPEILVHKPLSCGGVGDCGVCAIHTKKGWKLACKDGPVFDFTELEIKD